MTNVLVLRSCNELRQGYGGFQWPESGPVSAPDWNPEPVCGGGLHGFLWGEGDSSLADFSDTSQWLVVSVPESSIVHLSGKVKFPSGVVVFCGDPITAGKYVVENGGMGKRVICGTATAGDRGTATAGDRGTATAGYRGTATAGYRGTATAGDSGTATAGDSGTATAGAGGTATAGYSGTATAGAGGTATAGAGGVIAILRWNGKRYKAVVATVKDKDGDGQLEPNTRYRLNDSGEFEVVPMAAG